MKISFINHASILIEHNSIRLLTDPWYFGYCFENGWGLRYDNPNALEVAKTATHLWISHFHQDHFHIPTLQELFKLNPEITIIGNRSYNFKLDEAVKRLGFKNIIPFEERVEFALAQDFTIKRYPTTGIDNMLLIKTSEGVILNYNDCSLPAYSQKKLKKEIGEIDILLTNFNHAGKLLVYPYPDNEKVKRNLLECFSDNYKIFDPKVVLPFASHHYYRAQESIHQNDSMIESKDLSSFDDKILAWSVGESYSYNNLTKKLELIEVAPTTKNKFDVLEITEKSTEEELIELSKKYAQTLKNEFGFVTFFIPNLNIRIADLNISFALNPRKGFVKLKENEVVNISAKSYNVKRWFSKIYGTDSFVVGAHFTLENKSKVSLVWEIVLGLLIDNKLSLKNIFSMLFKKSGLTFLWNRREEVIGILFSGRLAAEYHKE